jgi:hypothetical protein
MTMLLIAVSALSGFGFARVWSSRAPRATRIAVALPLALLPVVAAIAAGGWLVRWEFVRIAQTGSGGIGRVSEMFLGWSNAALAGLVAGAGVLLVAALIARRPDGGVEAEARRRPPTATPAILAVLLAASVAGVAVMLRAVETVSLATIPTGGAMAEVLPPDPPARVVELSGVPAPERVGLLTQAIQTTTWGGMALAMLLVAIAAATRRAERADWGGSRVVRLAAPTAAVVLVAAAGWACVRLWSTSTFLRDIG